MRGLVTHACRLAGVIALIFLTAGVAAAEEHPKAEAHGADGESTGASQYLELDAMTVTLYRDDLPAGMLTTRLVLQLESPDARAAVRAAERQLRDVLLRELYRLTEQESRNGPKVDLDRVKVYLLRAARKELGPDIVKDLLVQALLRRGA